MNQAATDGCTDARRTDSHRPNRYRLEEKHVKKLTRPVRPLLLCLCAAPGPLLAADCLIYVHGKQTDTGTYTNWNTARDYWKDDSRDFVKEATKNFATD